MNEELKELLKKPSQDWTFKDELLFMKITKKKPTADTVKKTPIDEVDSEDLEELKEKAPKKKNLVVLPKDEPYGQTLPGAEPYIYKVKKGDTLNKIAEMFSVSYSELSNYLLSKEGNTSIYEGQEIQIPRHFIDLTQA